MSKGSKGRRDAKRIEVYHRERPAAEVLRLGEARAGKSSLRRAHLVGERAREEAQVFFQQALSLFRGDKPAEADRLLRVALAVEERPASLDLLGQIRYRLEDFRGASKALSRAVRLAPGHPGLLVNLATAQQAAGAFEAAETTLREAHRLAPQDAAVLCALGNLHWARMQQGEAMRRWENALAADPNCTDAQYRLMTAYLAADHLTPEQVADEHRRFGAFVHEKAGEAQRSHPNDRDPNRPLRVGYASGGFRHHPVASFLWGALEHHDPAAVQVYCYSEVLKPDQTTAELRALVEGRGGVWRDTLGKPDAEVAEMVRADAIDVWVDLSGHTEGNRLHAFARRPAPVSVTWMGYAATTGVRAIDYRLVDGFTDPPGAEALATERLWRLPNFLAFRPDPAAPPVETAPPVLRRGVVAFGSFNYSSKVGPQTVRAWAAILHRVPRSRLLLKSVDFADPIKRQRLLQAFEREGVASGRLELRRPSLGFGDHLAQYADVDVALDPWPYNGTTTTCEALWQGVPVVTLCGDRHAARVGASLLTAADPSEELADLCVAETVADYIDKAVRLATRFDLLDRLRATMRARLLASPLFDGRALARNLESAYRGMWRRWCAEPPTPPDPREAEERQFVQFLRELVPQSRAQLAQDLWVAFESRGQRGGYFVEFGATDGRSINNTSLLEECFDWRGILAEPFPVWHEALHRNRPLAAIDHRAVWRSTGERLKFRATDAAELAGLEATLPRDANAPARAAHRLVEVETVSLVDLLRSHQAPPVIDYLSIDTEGSELEVLRAFDFGAYRVRLISVEHNHTPARREIFDLLTSKGYERKFAGLSQWDDWYKLND